MRTPDSLRAFRPESESPEEYRERYYDSIPYEFQHLVCMCTNAEIKDWQRKQPEGIHTKSISFKDGIVKCAACSKYRTLWTYLEICFSCDEMYVIKVCPDKMLLCEGCGG